MAFNVRPGGVAESVKVPNTVKSGDLVRRGSLIGIAQIDATEGDDGDHYTTLALEGIARISNKTGGTRNEGDPIYTGAAGPGTVTANKHDEGHLIGIVTRGGANNADIWVKLVPNATVEV